ncbi:MAG TPA: PQQ-binding-like beta-propeller repeat protein [Terriglobia bacterium]|nr:PQQ-binding-like beta-propeller repeat protein [Terriglobia bacterium]
MSRIFPSSPDNGLYAINPDGSLKWRFPTALSATSPAIGTDGTIYVTDGALGGPSVYAVNPDGSQKWSFKPGASILSSPAIGPDGTIYVASLENTLIAISPHGTLKWNYTSQRMSGSVGSTPVVDADGTIYIGGPQVTTDTNKVFAVNADGSTKWVAIANDVVLGTAIGSTGTLYVGAANSNITAGTLYAFGPASPH